MNIRALVALFVLIGSLSAPGLAQPPKGWLDGSIDAINIEQRRVIIAEQEYRIALRARVTDFSGADLTLHDLDLSYAVAYRLDKETGDILDIQVIAYP